MRILVHIVLRRTLRTTVPLVLTALVLCSTGCASLEGHYGAQSQQWDRSDCMESFWVLLAFAAQVFGPMANR
jgi:hypothetical protein